MKIYSLYKVFLIEYRPILSDKNHVNIVDIQKTNKDINRVSLDEQVKKQGEPVKQN
jgi:hypothetical protein